MSSPVFHCVDREISRERSRAHGAGDRGLELALDVVTHGSGLARLEAEWAALFDQCHATATLFQSFEWARECFERGGSTSQLCILTARHSGELVAVAPLMVDRHLGLPTLRWIGGHLAIYGDVLAAATVDVSEWLQAVFDDLAQRGIASGMLLENVRADARVAVFLRERGRVTGRQAAPVLDMEVSASFARWQASLSKDTRRTRKRRLRNLEACGEVCFHFETGGAHVQGRIRQLFALKRAWASSRRVVSRTIGDPNFEALVTALVTGGGAAKSRISTLSLNGQPIAVELGFVMGDRYLSYLGAYDPHYQAHSPGSPAARAHTRGVLRRRALLLRLAAAE